MKIMPQEIDPEGDALEKKEPTDTLTEKKATQEPEKYQIPGLDGEYTAEQIREWNQDSQNKGKWRKEYDEKGKAFNEWKRQTEDNLMGQATEVNSKIAEINARLAKQEERPKEDWRGIDDPDKKMDIFFKDIDSRVAGMENTNKQWRDNTTATDKARLVKTENERWTVMADDILDRMGAPDDPKSRRIIQGHMGLELGEIGRQRWSPETFKTAAKNAVDSFDSIKESGVKEFVDGKKKDDKLRTGSPGGAPAPTKVKFTPGMSRRERMEIIAKDPNVK